MRTPAPQLAAARGAQAPCWTAPAGRGDLPARLLTAAVALPLVVVLLGHSAPTARVTLAVAAAIAAAELGRLSFERGAFERRAVWVGALLMVLAQTATIAAALAVTCVMAAWTAAVFRGEVAGVPNRAGRLAAVLLLVGGGLFCLASLRALPDGTQWLFSLLAATWLNDAGAYFVGRRWGAHKLRPAISPGKSWEGFAGGAVTSLALAAGLAQALPGFTAKDAAALWIITATLGPLGDLTKSIWKRDAHVKDTGRLLPGHGGMMDRVDALLFNAPAFLLYVVALR